MLRYKCVSRFNDQGLFSFFSLTFDIWLSCLCLIRKYLMWYIVFGGNMICPFCLVRNVRRQLVTQISFC